MCSSAIGTTWNMELAVTGLLAQGVVIQLFLPVGRSAVGREVKEVPERLEGAAVARILARIGRGVVHLGAPEMPNLVALAVEDRHHGHLEAFGRLGMVVAFEA